jgi:nucleotide-binding universal stress UspA family protein
MRILLAVDGSDQSFEAARSLAHFVESEEVTLLHAVDVPQPAYPKITPEVARDIYMTVEREIKAEGERLLEQVASLLPMGIGPITKRLEVGKPADAILAVAQEKHVDLVLLGTRGVGPMKAVLLGSVSHRVLSYAHSPVMAVNHPVRSLRRILLPVKGVEDAEAGIKFLAQKPFREQPEVTIITAVSLAPAPWPTPSSVTDPVKKDVLDGARYFVEAIAERLSTHSYKVKSVVDIGFPASLITKQAEKGQADLIMMGSRGRHGVTRFVLGSVSHAVLYEAKCPVMMFPWPGA